MTTRTCGAKHTSGVTCHLTAPHELHIGGSGVRVIGWPNADYKAPKPRKKSAKQLEAEASANKLREVAERVRRHREAYPGA